MNFRSLIVLSCALLLSFNACAQDDAGAEEVTKSPISWNLALTSEYMFRGVTVTPDDPALQGSVTFSLDNGIYFMLWGSNVDFGDGSPDTELDSIIGWNRALSDDWTLDLSAAHYSFFGENSTFGNIDYNEFFARLTYGGAVTGMFAYTDDYANAGDSASYYQLSASKEVGGSFVLGTSIGYSTFGSTLGIRDYADWSISASRQSGPVNASLMFVGTDSDGRYNSGKNADDRVVLTLSIGG